MKTGLTKRQKDIISHLRNTLFIHICALIKINFLYLYVVLRGMYIYGF